MSDESDIKPNVKSLAELRDAIDRVDREILELLRKRTEIVTHVAAFKRNHRVQIRDFVREREVLNGRREIAESLGLNGGVIESIYRLIMLASRDYQASLKVEVPLDMEPKRIALIGGAGQMGELLARMFRELGHDVRIADVATTLSAPQAARDADVVVVSVPIEVTEQVIRDIGPHLRPDALLMDITSIKQGPLNAMLEATQASVIGTHPMFGPGVHSLQGQRVVLCPGRGEAWQKWLTAVLVGRGLQVTVTTAEQHDRAMALVQVLTHFQTQVLGLALSRLKIPLAESLTFTSPAYLMELYVAARHFAQAPELYGPIEMLNPMTQTITATFRAAADEVSEILRVRDQQRFNAMFDEVRAFFGDFTAEALEQSSFLIDRLVERTLGAG
jgi:chorismate mutase/prephenate dehydrogenase